MGKTVSGKFALQAAFNGLTLRSEVKTIAAPGQAKELPLLQWVTNEGTAYPSFTEDGNHPCFYAYIADTKGTVYATGVDGTKDAYADLFWNGTKITFGSNNYSNGTYMSGVFKRSLRTVDGVVQTVFEIVDDIADAWNMDSDELYISGKTTVMGNYEQEYHTGIARFDIILRSGNATDDYVVVLDVNDATNAAAGTIKAMLYTPDGVLLSGFTSLWENMDGTTGRAVAKSDGSVRVDGYTLSETGSASQQHTLTVSPSVITGEDTFRVTLTYGGKDYVAFAYICDLTDGIFAAYEFTSGVDAGGYVADGATAKVKLLVVDESGTQTSVPTGYEINVVLRGNDGATLTAGTDYTLSSATTDGSRTLTVTYARLVAHGGGINGYITIDAT